MQVDGSACNCCRKQGDGIEAKTLSVWHITVHNIRAEIVSWTTRQSKHAAVGYPFITMLLCLEGDTPFSASVDSQIDHLLRQLKARQCIPWQCQCSGLCCYFCEKAGLMSNV